MIYLRQEYTDIDVVIAGAGPAGAAAATYLARAGLRVVLLDQSRFPRDKVCGDFVSPVAIEELRQLGVAGRVEFERANVIDHAAVSLDGRHLLSRSFPGRTNLPRYGRVVPRLDLDAWIVDAARRAGARVTEGARVISYEVEPRSVRVEAVGAEGAFSLRASLLIGADGSSSTVARRLRGAGIDARDRIVAVRGYYRGVAGPSNRADVFFNSETFPGYAWLFPTGEGTANVGVGVALDTFPTSERNLREVLRDLIVADGALRERLRDATLVGKVTGWPLATFNPHLPIHADRVLLVGDAANLINPINGEGIQTALLSARWAAEAALVARRAGFERAALDVYAARVEGELRYDMALSCFLVQCIRNGALNPFWLRMLRVITERAKKDEAYAEAAGGILAGVVPASSALSPKVILGTLQEALLQFGVGALETSLGGGPPAMFDAGRDALRFSGDVLASALSDPDAWVRWLRRTAVGATEVASQAAIRLAVPLAPAAAAIERRGPRLIAG